MHKPLDFPDSRPDNETIQELPQSITILLQDKQQSADLLKKLITLKAEARVIRDFYSIVQRKTGGHPALCKIYGDHLRGLNLHEEALSAYSELIDDDESHILRIDTSIQLKILREHAQALSTLEPIIHSSPNRAIAVKQYGINLFLMRRQAEAQRWLNEALIANKNDAEALEYLTKCLLLSDPESIDAGVNGCDRGCGDHAASHIAELKNIYIKFNLNAICNMRREICRNSTSANPNPVEASEALSDLNRISAMIEEGKPLSLIRIGDGEGSLLAIDALKKVSPNLVERNVNIFLEIWFGEATSTFRPELSRLILMLNKAVESADIIGIPDEDWIARDWNDVSLRGVPCLIAATIKAAEVQAKHQQAKLFTSTDIHRKMLESGLIEEISSRRDFLGIVTCRDITEGLKTRFGIKQIDTYICPSQVKYTYLAGHGEYVKMEGELHNEPHYPDAFDRIINSIHVPYQGALFFVGAGLLGKLYCNAIKDKGGIAIDLGSLFDAWANIRSRAFISETPELFKL